MHKTKKKINKKNLLISKYYFKLQSTFQLIQFLGSYLSSTLISLKIYIHFALL